MRKFNWLVSFVVLTCLVSYFIIWPWYRDRSDAATINALIADVGAASDEIDQAITGMRETPRVADVQRLQELHQKNQGLLARMKEAVPKLKGDPGNEFREAQDRHLKQSSRMYDKINAMKGQIDELTKKRSP